MGWWCRVLWLLPNSVIIYLHSSVSLSLEHWPSHLTNLIQLIVRETSISSHVLASSIANISSVAYTREFWQQLFSDWLPSRESIVEPMSGKWSYKEVCYWSRHVSDVSSLKGEGFFALPTAHYTAGRFHLRAEPIIPFSWIAVDWLRTTLYWTSIAWGNIKENIEYYHHCNAPFNLPHHSLCTMLVLVCSCR